LSFFFVFGIVRYFKKNLQKLPSILEKWTSIFPRVRGQWMVTKTSQMLLLTSLAKAKGKKEVRADGLAVHLTYKKIRADRHVP
jgi:hypothetical protein